MPNYTYTNDRNSAVKNKLGAKTYDELEQLEAEKVAARAVEIELGYGPSGSFDASHLKALHRHLFQDIYEWAGHTRDERFALSDGTVATEPFLQKMDGSAFMPGPVIPKALDRIAATVREANYLRDLPREEFATRAADIMLEINGIHAFREGNGRTQRTFMQELAKQAGHDLDFTVVSRERMIQASIAGNDNDDPAMMRRMFNEISDPVRVEALDKAIGALTHFGTKWDDNYVATMEPGHKVEAIMVGVAGKQFMARTNTEILIGQSADLPIPYPKRQQTFTIEPTTWKSEREPPAPTHEPEREPPKDRPRGRGGR